MKNENDILEMLSRREEEFHLPLRPDSWEKLEKELAPQLVARRIPYRWLAVAAVLLLCLLVSLPLFFKKETPANVSEKVDRTPATEQQPESGMMPSSETHPPVAGTTHTAQTPDDSVASFTRYVFTAIFFPEVEVDDSDVVLQTPAVPERVMLADQNEQTTKHNSDVGPQQEKRFELSKHWTDRVQAEKKNSAKWSFGVLAGSSGVSGRGGLEGIEQYETNPGPVPPPPEDPDEGKNPDEIRTKASSGGGSGSGGSTRYRYYRHRLPVTASLSVRYEFLPQLALESGLSYTNLYSDITYRDNSRVGSQSLHYLGVPLKINWTFYDRKKFSLYLSGGAMLEYCLSARKTDERYTETLDVYPWQASFHAGLGAQLELVKPLSLFVEPGVGYYFKTLDYRRRTLDVETIRTVHPFTFNLQVGIRFTY